LLHETLHILQGHLLTQEEYKLDPSLWNIATDLWINDLLKQISNYEVRAIRPFEKLLFPDKEPWDTLLKKALGTNEVAKESTEMEVYRALEKLMNSGRLKIVPKSRQGQNQNQGQGQGQGQNQEQQQEQGETYEIYLDGKKVGEITRDTRIVGGKEFEEAKEAHERAKTTARIARDAQKSRGAGSSPLEEVLDEILRPKLPWHKLLEKAIALKMVKSNSTTWVKPKWYLGTVVPLPGVGDEEKFKIAMVIDTSGSISLPELKKFKGAVAEALEEDLVEEIIELQHTDKLTAINRYTPEEFDIENSDLLKVAEVGGTSHEEVFNWLEQNIEEEQIGLVVMLTDAYSDIEELVNSGKYSWYTYTPCIVVTTGRELKNVPFEQIPIE